MYEFLKGTFLSTKYIDSLIRRVEKFDEEQLIDLLEFITHLKEKEYTEIVRIWNSPHINSTMWHNYKIYGLKDLPEQIELDTAWKEFITKIRIYLHSRHRKIHSSEEKVAERRANRIKKRNEIEQTTS